RPVLEDGERGVVIVDGPAQQTPSLPPLSRYLRYVRKACLAGEAVADGEERRLRAVAQPGLAEDRRDVVLERGAGATQCTSGGPGPTRACRGRAAEGACAWARQDRELLAQQEVLGDQVDPRPPRRPDEHEEQQE